MLARTVASLCTLCVCGACSHQVDLATPGDAELSEWCAVALSLLYCHTDAAGLIDGQKVTRIPNFNYLYFVIAYTAAVHV